jgi:hypothetical protein
VRDVGHPAVKETILLGVFRLRVAVHARKVLYAWAELRNGSLLWQLKVMKWNWPE